MRIAIAYSRVSKRASVDRKSVEVERDGVVDACKNLGYETRVFPVGAHFELRRLKKEILEYKPDCIFNLVEELDEHPQGEFVFAYFLERIGIPYTGCNPESIFTGLHKHITKMILSYYGIQTPPFELVKS
ncbi:MAG: hypothetical protein ACPL6C_04800, partial [bacterium]